MTDENKKVEAPSESERQREIEILRLQLRNLELQLELERLRKQPTPVVPYLPPDLYPEWPQIWYPHRRRYPGQFVMYGVGGLEDL
jgi:hypothetical protein